MIRAEIAELLTRYIGKFGALHPNAKPVVQLSLNEDYLNDFSCAVVAERETGISKSHICSVCKGGRKTAGNYKWRYKDEL